MCLYVGGKGGIGKEVMGLTQVDNWGRMVGRYMSEEAGIHEWARRSTEVWKDRLEGGQGQKARPA